MGKLPVERGLPLVIAVLCALGAVLFLELLARRRRRRLADGASATASAAFIPIQNPTPPLISENPQDAAPAATPESRSTDPTAPKRAAPVIELDCRVEGFAGSGYPVTLPQGAKVRIAG